MCTRTKINKKDKSRVGNHTSGVLLTPTTVLSKTNIGRETATLPLFFRLTGQTLLLPHVFQMSFFFFFLKKSVFKVKRQRLHLLQNCI